MLAENYKLHGEYDWPGVFLFIPENQINGFIARARASSLQRAERAHPRGRGSLSLGQSQASLQGLHRMTIMITFVTMTTMVMVTMTTGRRGRPPPDD